MSLIQQITVEQIIAKVAAQKQLRKLKSKNQKQQIISKPNKKVEANNHKNISKIFVQQNSYLPQNNKLLHKQEQLTQQYINLKKKYRQKLNLNKKYQQIQQKLRNVLVENKKLQQSLNMIRMKSMYVLESINQQEASINNNSCHSNRNHTMSSISKVNCTQCECRKNQERKYSKKQKKCNKKFHSSIDRSKSNRKHALSSQILNNTSLDSKSPQKISQFNYLQVQNSPNYQISNSHSPNRNQGQKNTKKQKQLIKFNQDRKTVNSINKNQENSQFNPDREEQSQEIKKEMSKSKILKEQIVQILNHLAKITDLSGLTNFQQIKTDQINQMINEKNEKITKLSQMIEHQKKIIKQYQKIQISGDQYHSVQPTNLLKKQNQLKSRNLQKDQNLGKKYTSGTIVKIKKNRQINHYQKIDESGLKGRIQGYENHYYHYQNQGSTKKKNRADKINPHIQSNKIIDTKNQHMNIININSTADLKRYHKNELQKYGNKNIFTKQPNYQHYRNVYYNKHHHQGPHSPSQEQNQTSEFIAIQ